MPASIARTALALCLLLLSGNAAAAQQSGCFSGRDHFGQPALVFLTAERHGDWFEIYGRIHSASTGQIYRFKADGHSGAGRVYARHEYEAGAAYIQILRLDQAAFVVEVDGYGVFHYQRSSC